jgi:N-acetylglucosamine-6-phosphate deacetylase
MSPTISPPSIPTGRHAIAADSVFDGIALHHGCAVVIEGADIVGLMPRRDLPAAMPVRDMPDGAWLAPGFIDVQVNGGGDVLFNDTPTPAGIAAIVAAHRRFGTTSLLPTLISDSAPKMREASAAVTAAAKACPSVLGIHFEGPFLSPERAGVHDPAMIRPPAPDDLDLLCAPRGGVTLATLAPERAPPGFIASLARRGVRVALGHSMATYAETRAAIAEGLSGFTHLFNAMRPMSAREPGPIAAALEAPSAFYGLIVDGEHVAPAMLRLALRGAGQPLLVTDAMPPVGGTRHSFRLGGKRVHMREGRCTTEDGTLAGSALDMASAVRNCVRLLGLSLPEALRLAAAAPAAFLGVEERLGHLAPGCRADLVAFDPAEIRVLATWVAGEANPPALESKAAQG